MLQSPSQIVIEEWQRRVHAEYNSAILSARLLLFLKAHANIPTRFLTLCERIVQDEISHAKMGLDNLLSWGVDSPLRTEEIVLPQHLPPLEDALMVILDSFALGETFAIPIFQGMLANAKNISCQRVLRTIVKDERMHSQFGWDLLDILLELSPTEGHQACQRQLMGTISQFHQGYAGAHLDFMLADSDLVYGLLDGASYQRIWFQCYREIVQPRLQERGFSTPKL